ncbi:MAG: hypothetical protein IJP30_03845 [Clostridia bacterium]|nr:hypothetical protein [Clostridia bacterium]
MDFAKSVFSLLFPISLLLSVFFYQDEKKGDSNPSQGTKRTKQESTIRTIGLIVTLIIILAGLILVQFKHKGLVWIYIAVGMPMYLSRLAGTYVSVGIIGKVVRSEKTDKLSVREHWAIETVAYTLFFLDVYKLPAKLLEYVASIENIPVSDCLYITIYVSLLFLYVFLTCALLPVPLSLLSKLLIKANRLIRERTSIYRIGDFFIKRIDPKETKRPLLIVALEVARRKHAILRILVWIISPAIIVIDACLVIVRTLWSFLIASVGYVFLILRLIKRTIGRVTVWINNLSDRHLVATSFRVALIATLAITVVCNRYTPLLREYETSTAVLEFVASAILIPVIFEWISSTKNKMR